MHSACRLMLVNICMKFHEDTLNGFPVTQQTRFCDGQTYGWTDRQTTQAKKICLPTLKWGDLIMNISAKFHLHPPYGFWGEDLFRFFRKFSLSVAMATNQIQWFVKNYMFGRGLFNKYFWIFRSKISATR